MRHTLLDRPHRCPSRAGLGLLGSAVLLLSACTLGDSPGHGGLRVQVIDNPVAASPLDAAPVQLQGWAITGMTDNAGYAAFADLPAGDYIVSAHRVGYCSATAPVTVVAGVTTELTLPLCPSEDGSTGGQDLLAIPTPGALPGLLLFDAAVAGTCLHDQLAAGTAEYLLPVNALPPGSTGGSGEPCPTSATVFTPSHGLRFTDDPAVLPWTGGTDHLAFPLPAPLKVPLAIWVAPGIGSTTLTSQIRDHLKEAARIFDAAGAGLALVGDELAGGAPPIVDIAASSAGAALFPTTGTGCDAAAAITAEPSVYQADKLNIYYVPVITGRGSGSIGYYCYLEGVRSILFVNAAAGLPHTLAHELGHALGLLEPNWGHTHGYLSDFLTLPPVAGNSTSTPRNFMAYGAAGEVERPIYATLGQVFRMNFSPLSWANLPGSGGLSLRERAGALPASVACPCAAADATENCPILALTGNLPDYLTAGPGWELACSIVPASESITMCTGDAEVLKGTFGTSIGGVALPAMARYADIIWSSDNPATIAVDIDKQDTGVDVSGAGWASLAVTGGAVGVATVTLSAGGPSASARFAIEVKACP